MNDSFENRFKGVGLTTTRNSKTKCKAGRAGVITISAEKVWFVPAFDPKHMAALHVLLFKKGLVSKNELCSVAFNEYIPCFPQCLLLLAGLEQYVICLSGRVAKLAALGIKKGDGVNNGDS